MRTKNPMPKRPQHKTGKQVAVLVPFTPLHCGVIEWEVLPGGTETPPTVCQALATVRRAVTTSVDPTHPHQDDAMVCAYHWRMMYLCQACGAPKGTWQDALCLACADGFEAE